EGLDICILQLTNGIDGRFTSKIRFDTTALRLAYDATGQAIGVDLLSGERVSASKAIISNLTLWDTYGKLIGLDHTASGIRKRLKICEPGEFIALHPISASHDTHW
ncbi:MAG: hypothetical protein ND866_02005, partial [Pyrinomonadaceae bacterium]|nr:hypothetical protein [Pyrinomonadaceae bacterium]